VISRGVAGGFRKWQSKASILNQARQYSDLFRTDALWTLHARLARDSGAGRPCRFGKLHQYYLFDRIVSV